MGITTVHRDRRIIILKKRNTGEQNFLICFWSFSIWDIQSVFLQCKCYTWEMCKERILFHSTSPVQVRLGWYPLVRMVLPFLSKLFSSGMVLHLLPLPVKAVPLKEFLASDTLWNRPLDKTLRDVKPAVLEILFRSFSAATGKEQWAHRVTWRKWEMRTPANHNMYWNVQHVAELAKGLVMAGYCWRQHCGDTFSVGFLLPAEFLFCLFFSSQAHCTNR